MIAFKTVQRSDERFTSRMAAGPWLASYDIGERTLPPVDGTRLFCRAGLPEVRDEGLCPDRIAVLEVEVPDDSPCLIMSLCTDQRLWELNWRRCAQQQIFGYLIGLPYFHVRYELRDDGLWQRILPCDTPRCMWRVNKRWILAEYCNVLREIPLSVEVSA